MYKTIFIDWDGTLSNSKFWERWSKDPEYRSKYDLIQRILFQNAHDLLHDWMLGFRSMTFVVNYLADVTGLSYDELMTELRYSCEHMEFLEESTIDAIQNVRKKGTRVIIATDNMDTFRQWTVPALRINDLFDGILTSDTRGAFKVQSSANGASLFFHHYLSQNNLKSGEAVLIDDSIDNKVVENFGIDFLHVNAKTGLASYLAQLV